MPKMTGGQAVADTLIANRVQVAFGMPGIHNLPIYDALLDRPALRHILVRNEQGGSMMANAVGRVTGRPGVCLVTTGPAACNALAGVADAARESTPMLVIASQIGSHLIGQSKGAFHEMADQMGMFAAAGAWTTRAARVEHIPAAINAAWVAATHGRPRPAYVEIPHDILFAQGEVHVAPAPEPPRPGGRPAQIAEIVRRLASAERPLIYAGNGCAGSFAEADLAHFAGRLGIPVVTTINGKGALSEDHLLSAGCLPIGDPTCKELFALADVVLALGAGMGETSTAGWSRPAPRDLIQVDIDGAQIGRNAPVSLGVVGDVGTVLRQLNQAAGDLPARLLSPWAAYVVGLGSRIQTAVEGQPGAQITHAMRRMLPSDAIVIGDASGWNSWQLFHYPVYGARQSIIPINFGALGYSAPAAIGAQAAFPERRVVACCGDGGFLFCAQELATARQHHLPIIAIVANDGGFGTVKYYQQLYYGAERFTAADLLNPDFVAYAHAFGCFGRRIEDPGQFEPALRQALESGLPAVLELTFPIPRTPRDYGLPAWAPSCNSRNSWPNS